MIASLFCWEVFFIICFLSINTRSEHIELVSMFCIENTNKSLLIFCRMLHWYLSIYSTSLVSLIAWYLSVECFIGISLSALQNKYLQRIDKFLRRAYRFGYTLKEYKISQLVEQKDKALFAKILSGT